VLVVEAYRTLLPERGEALPLNDAGVLDCDCITFTSSSTVQNFVALAGADALRGVAVASIGPITTRTARDLGIEVTAEAGEFTIEGLLEAVRRICETRVTPPSDQ
jgi:uroporphyrinogen III methyltransferase/synthase